MGFGSHVRELREARRKKDKSFSIRSMSKRLEIAPNYLSKIELEQCPPPGEKVVIAIATELGQNRDIMLAMAGKVSQRLKDAIVRRPRLFAELIDTVERLPEEAVLRFVREVRDGKW